MVARCNCVRLAIIAMYGCFFMNDVQRHNHEVHVGILLSTNNRVDVMITVYA